MAYHWWSVAFWASSICMNPHESPLSLSTQSCWGILGYCVAGLALPDHLSGQVAGSSLLLPWTYTYFWDHSSWVGLSALNLLCDWNLHWPLLWGASGYLLCGQRTVEPKPRRRGGGRVQHASVQSKLIVDFLTAVFNHVEFGDLLYRIAYHPCKLQTAMGVTSWRFFGYNCWSAAGARFLPRRGAVEAYRCGAELAKLCRRMKLKSLNTLEHYIQEVAADSLLVSLEPRSRDRIKKFASMFEPCWFVFPAP